MGAAPVTYESIAHRLKFYPEIHLISKSTIDEEGFRTWKDSYIQKAGTSIENTSSPVNEMEAAISATDVITEFAGRVCYNSYLKGRERGSYIENLLSSKHGSVLEHTSFTFAISGISRSLTHELIRHRAGTAISQESQRYVDASDINFVVPPALIDCCDYDFLLEFYLKSQKGVQNYIDVKKILVEHYKCITHNTHELKKKVHSAARSMLPNCCETKIVWTVNARAVRHIIEQRASKNADEEIRRFAFVLAIKLKNIAPLIFNDFDIDGVEGTVSMRHSKV